LQDSINGRMPHFSASFNDRWKYIFASAPLALFVTLSMSPKSFNA
jgi:hypothetical protein